MKKYYLKRPAVIEAFQWNGKYVNGGLIRPVPKGGSLAHRVCTLCGRDFPVHGAIMGTRGVTIVCPYDWVVTNEEGERYPIPSNIFNEVYRFHADEGTEKWRMADEKTDAYDIEREIADSRKRHGDCNNCSEGCDCSEDNE